MMNCEDLLFLVSDFYFSFLQMGKVMGDFITYTAPHWKSPGVHSREIGAQGFNGIVIWPTAEMKTVIARAHSFLMFYQCSIIEIIICTLSVKILQGLL